MKTNFLKISLLAVVLLLSNSEMFGTLGGQFEDPTIVTYTNYDRIDLAGPDVRIISASEFENAAGFDDPDNGYYELDMEFDYSFGSLIGSTDKLWISVNGFVTFNPPLNLPQADPNGLFEDDPARYQENVVAPFWGDHYYRTISSPSPYTPSQIIVYNGEDKVIVEWRNLNINDPSIPSSVGNFQVHIYKSEIENNDQGKIEFAYGTVNVGGTGNEVVTQGASIGLKATGLDYINGLCYDPLDNTCDPQGSTRLSAQWQPSGGTNLRITMDVKPRTPVFQFWGDGDTDLSQGPGERHEGLPQNRFVTFNDVRKILRSRVEVGKELDSALGREAFHADVDHDGRFARIDTVIWATDENGVFIGDDGRPLIYDAAVVDPITSEVLEWVFYTNSTRSTTISAELVVVPLNDVNRYLIPRQSERYQDDLIDLPFNVTDINQIHFMADEHDAKIITEYLMAKVPVLYWIHDTSSNGKVTEYENMMNNITFGDVEEIDGIYKLPVYPNGNAINGLSTFFETDASIEAVELVNNEDPFAIAEFEQGRFVFVGSSEYNEAEPFAYIYVSTNSERININNVRVNDNDREGHIINLGSAEESSRLVLTPNIISKANNEVNLIFESDEDNGNVSVQLFDMSGNLIKTIHEGSLVKELNFNATDNLNQSLSSGVYLLKYSTNNFNFTEKLIVE